MLETGIAAPDFELHATPNQKLALSGLKGKNVVLAFYPADWSPVCSDQMSGFNEVHPSFSRYNAVLLAISVDGKWCHAAFRENRKLHFTLLADFEPKGAVAQKYGVYNQKEGRSERALFVIDHEGIIRWSFRSPSGMNPGTEGIIKALEMIAGKNNE